MRNAFAKALYEEALKDERICVLAADISPAGPMAQFAEEFPRRFINTGVAEQATVGMAAGMALKGMRPFVYTIATFSLYRPFEFVRDDLAYQNLPVTVVGMGSGLNYSTLGSTHHSQEDVAIACAIPNMQVIAPCDPAECVAAVQHCAKQQLGPVYLRLGKAGEPELTRESEPWYFGRVRYVRKVGRTCIISYGPTVATALQVADLIGDSSVVSCHTLKPLERLGIIQILHDHDNVFVIEEHSPYGGLGARVKEIAFECRARCRLETFSLKDQFVHYHGDREELLRRHELTAPIIVAKMRRLWHISNTDTPRMGGDKD